LPHLSLNTPQARIPLVRLSDMVAIVGRAREPAKVTVGGA